jgi:MEMO1 family protein
MDRTPVVAGQFYPGNQTALQEAVAKYLQGSPSSQKTLLAMVPHAGYVFSGPTAGKTIASSHLADRVVLIGPNHTGRGQKLAVWSDGKWILPGLSVPVDSGLAASILDQPGFSADYEAHLYEHSLEVVLPFLHAVKSDLSVVPIAVAEPGLENLLLAGKNLALAIEETGLETSLVVSSDMSHFISHHQAEEKDKMAIDRILALDPEGLYRTVRSNNISMCGMLPMVLGLSCVKELGAAKATLVDYTTSGEVNKDYSQVVGYAGILVS